MPKIRYHVAGIEAVEDITPDLVPYYTGRPGYTIVVDEQAAAELTGAELLEAARNAGVQAPTTLTADEKRDAIVEATAPHGDGVPATIVPADDGVPVITPDPVPATKPARTNSRGAAHKES